MKKVFISCPMEGRTTENISKTMDKMYECAEATLGEKVVAISRLATSTAPSGIDKRIWYLGESIKVLSDADLIVTLSLPYHVRTKGCEIEQQVAAEYGIEILNIGGDCFKYFCPDLAEAPDFYSSMYNTPTCSASEANDE